MGFFLADQIKRLISVGMDLLGFSPGLVGDTRFLIKCTG